MSTDRESSISTRAHDHSLFDTCTAACHAHPDYRTTTMERLRDDCNRAFPIPTPPAPKERFNVD